MKIKLLLFFFFLVLFKPSYASISQEECKIDETATVVVVPDQVKSIQEAINRIQKNGIVLLSPGTFKENVTIPSGKKIILQGAGAKKTKILPGNKSTTTISIEQGAEACITGFTVKGGNTGIKAGEFLKNETILGKPAKLVVVKYTNIDSAENGLILNATKVGITKGKISGNFNFGAYIISPFIKIIGTNIFSNLGSGLILLSGIDCLLSDTFYTSEIIGADISGNNGPGLTVCGSSDVMIRNSFFEGNSRANIQIVDQLTGSTLITKSEINFAQSTDDFGGHGVLTYNSTNLNITNSRFFNNETIGILPKDSHADAAGNFFSGNLAGLYYVNSDGEVANNFILSNSVGIGFKGEPKPEILESNTLLGNGTNVDSLELPIPPKPLPPATGED